MGLLAYLGTLADAQAEVVLKIMVVNPSATEVKEFDIRSPLPPEVKPEHVLDAEGLKVDYDSQAGTYVLVGMVTLKPKESVVKRVVLEDVWIIPPDRFTTLRRETSDIMAKLTGTMYEERGRVMARAIERQLTEIEESQHQPLLSPVQHITQYREDIKRLQMVESDLVSLRQLMVMAALNPTTTPAPLLAADQKPANAASGHDRGTLSILATWRIIFVMLGLLGFMSLSFFLVWQRQLKRQLAKQAPANPQPAVANGNGHGTHADETTPHPRLAGG